MKVSTLGILVVLLLLVACGKSPEKPATIPPPTSEATQPDPAATAAGDAVKASLEQLIDLAKKGDCTTMAPLIALSHSGTDDDYKRSLRYETPTERVMADKECARMQVLLADLETYTYGDFSQEEESEGLWNNWTVNFQYRDGSSEKHAFAFLPQGNGYLLGDID